MCDYLIQQTMDVTQFITIVRDYIPNYLHWFKQTHVNLPDNKDYNLRFLAILAEDCHLPLLFGLHLKQDELLFDLSLAIKANHKRINSLYQID